MLSVTMPENLTVAQQVLLHLMSVQPCTAEHRAAVQHLAARVQWEQMLATTPPSLYPYVDHRLSTAFADVHVPETVRAVCAQATRTNAMLHLRRRLVLRELLQALAPQAIPVMLLKGAVLAHHVYPTPATRTMDDLDVLVPQARIREALTALQSAGFVFPERYHDYYSAVMHEPELPELTWPLERRGAPIFIELHTSIDFARVLPPSYLEALWAKSVPTALGGLACRMLAPEDFLFHICLHLSRYHKFQSGLRALLDIALYITHHRQTWDWAHLAATSQHHGFAAWMYVTLLLARRLLAAEIPDSFFACLSPPENLQAVLHLALDQLWDGTQYAPPSGVHLVQNTPLRQLPQLVWQRLQAWCWADMRDGPSLWRLPRIVRTAARHVYRLHLVPWWRTRGRGTHTKAYRERATHLQRGREQIEALMVTPQPSKGVLS